MVIIRQIQRDQFTSQEASQCDNRTIVASQFPVLHGFIQPTRVHSVIAREHAEEERLEAGEENDHGDDERRLALGRSNHGGRDDPERDEGEAVDHGVAQDRHQRDSGADDRRLHPEEERGSEEHRGLQRMTAERVDHEEPHGHDDRADDASDDAFAQDGALRSRHGTSRRHLSARDRERQPGVRRLGRDGRRNRCSGDAVAARSGVRPGSTGRRDARRRHG